MILPEAFKISTDVWLVPCRLLQANESYEPLAKPLKSEDHYISQNNLEEDQSLYQTTLERGAKNWSSVAKEHNLKYHNGKPIRNGKHCRERWYNHLNPELQKGQWSLEEDAIIVRKQIELGNKWSEISKSLPRRTENQVKNRFNSLKKRLGEVSRDDVLHPETKGQVTEFSMPHSQACPRLASFLAPSSQAAEIAKSEIVELEIHDQTKAEPAPPPVQRNEIIALPIRISSLTSDPELQSLPQRVFSNTSETETEPGSGSDIYYMLLSKSLDNLYSPSNEEKNELDCSLGNFMKGERLQLNFDSEGFNFGLFSALGAGEDKKFDIYGNCEFDRFAGFYSGQAEKMIFGQGLDGNESEMMKD